MAAMTFEDTAAVAELRTRIRAMIEGELSPEFLAGFVESAEWQEQANAFCRRLAARATADLRLARGARRRRGHDLGADGACARSSGPITNRGARSTWGSTGSGRRSCTSAPSSSGQQHLPAIASGNVVWCQGFSEPDAGSDLASLKLSAKRQPDGTFLANGQKIWTSYAGFADWCFLTTRTSTGSRKQQGITVFLVPMDRAGISVRPIDSILGPNHLNEVFFDDVLLSDSEILGRGRPGLGGDRARPQARAGRDRPLREE